MALISAAARVRSFLRRRGSISARRAASAARVRVAMVNSTSVSFFLNLHALGNGGEAQRGEAQDDGAALLLGGDEAVLAVLEAAAFPVEEGDPWLVLIDLL